MGYFVAEGKALSVTRGIVGADHEDPEIKPGDVGGIPGDAKSMAKAKKTLEELEAKGHVVKRKHDPAKAKAKADEAARVKAEEDAAAKAEADKAEADKAEADAAEAQAKADADAEEAKAAAEAAAAADPLAPDTKPTAGAKGGAEKKG